MRSNAPNILVVSANAKVPLVRSFQDAAKPYRASVMTTDLKPVCAAGLVADAHHQLPRLDTKAGIEAMLNLVQKENIGLIVPTRDGDLPLLAKARPAFDALSCHILCASIDVISTCRNKRKFSDAVEVAGLKAIPRLRPADLNYPAFIRPVIGAAGVGARKVDTVEDLPNDTVRHNYLFHPLIKAPEYSIDLLMGLEAGAAIQCVVRERLEVVGGEAKISRVENKPKIAEQALELGRVLGLVGHNVVQAFETRNGIRFIEVNPRFGGASNLSVQAGLASPERLLALCYGEDKSAAYAPRDIKFGATLYRHPADIIVTP